MHAPSARLGHRLMAQILVSALAYVVTALGVGVGVHLAYQRSMAQLSVLTSAQTTVMSMELAMVDQEDGQRGYDLTGDRHFLASFEIGQRAFSAGALRLRADARVLRDEGGSIRGLISLGEQWTGRYGVPQVAVREHGGRVSDPSLLAGGATFDRFRASAAVLGAALRRRTQAEFGMVSFLVQGTIAAGLVATAIEVGLILYLLRRRMTEMVEVVRHLREAVVSYAQGEFAPAVTVNGRQDELTDLVAGVARMRESLADAVAQAERRSRVDALTAVINRRGLDELLAERVPDAARRGQPLALAMVDIDLFKRYNDRYGHLAGDAALQATAALLVEGVREGDVVARYGGEEFALVLPGTTANEAAAVADRVRRLVAERIGPAITISVGVADLSMAERPDAASVVEAADRALYEAKRDGRNCVRLARGAA